MGKIPRIQLFQKKLLASEWKVKIKECQEGIGGDKGNGRAESFQRRVTGNRLKNYFFLRSKQVEVFGERGQGHSVGLTSEVTGRHASLQLTVLGLICLFKGHIWLYSRLTPGSGCRDHTGTIHRTRDQQKEEASIFRCQLLWAAPFFTAPLYILIVAVVPGSFWCIRR